MVIINCERGLGKTTSCIQESVRTKNHILAHNQRHKTQIMAEAAEMGVLDILPQVFTVQDIISARGVVHDFDNMIVDEGALALEAFLTYFGGSAAYITLSADVTKFRSKQQEELYDDIR